MGDVEKPQAKFFPPIKAPMLPSGSLNGRMALVTGGGTGLGRAIATTLSLLGAAVTIVGRRRTVIEGTASEISEVTGNKVLGLSMDVRDAKAVNATINAIETEFGDIPDLIVNNAAGNFISPATRLSLNAYKVVYDIVLNGTTNVTLETGKRLIAAGKRASYVSIITTYAYFGSGYTSPSAAAKAGVQAFSRSLAYEWGKRGIRLNCIAPGPFKSKGAWDRLDPTGNFEKHAINQLPIGRYGETEELANLATYMLSDYASWMTASTVIFDGGEFGFGAGEFNYFDRVTDKEWEDMEKKIRDTDSKDKGKKK